MSARPSSSAVGPRWEAHAEILLSAGGESTTMFKLARIFDLFEPLQKRIADGMPAFGTCAGMILLADRMLDGTADQETLGGLDITVRRNAFGRQVDSFETDLDVPRLGGEPVRAVFIRAPMVTETGPEVETWAELPQGVVLARLPFGFEVRTPAALRKAVREVGRRLMEM